MLSNFHAFLLSVDFFKINFFEKSFRNTCIYILANRLKQDQANIIFGLIWVQTISKGYQQTTKLVSSSGKRINKEIDLTVNKLLVSSADNLCKQFGP